MSDAPSPISIPDLLERAQHLCQTTRAQELEERGVLEPTRTLNPLWPPLRLDEYDMMERDLGKYILYWGAIRLALESLSKTLPGGLLRCLVVCHRVWRAQSPWPSAPHLPVELTVWMSHGGSRWGRAWVVSRPTSSSMRVTSS